MNQGMPTSVPLTVLFWTIRSKCCSALPADGLRQIDGVLGQDAGPDHVDHHRVDVAGLRRQKLLIVRETVGRGLRTEGMTVDSGGLAERGERRFLPGHRPGRPGPG